MLMITNELHAAITIACIQHIASTARMNPNQLRQRLKIHIHVNMNQKALFLV